MKIVLASQSPRRRELLAMITEEFDIVPAEVDESLAPGITPAAAVAELAKKKAEAVFSLPGFSQCCVIGSDTVVAVDDKILGKPADKQEAEEMLRLLSGRTHSVFTGMTVLSPAGKETEVVETQVTFYPLTDDQVDWYLATGEPYDKAGAYGIQGKGSLLVRRIEGDYGAVVGLSTPVLARMLRRLK